MLFGVGVGPNVNRDFEFGQVNDEKRKWTLQADATRLMAMKYFHTSHFRGNGPGRHHRLPARPAGAARRRHTRRRPGAVGSEGDHCGGPANTNFAFGNSVHRHRSSRGKWSFMMSLYIANAFKYAFPADAMTADNAALTGPSDTTWGSSRSRYELRPRSR